MAESTTTVDCLELLDQEIAKIDLEDPQHIDPVGLNRRLDLCQQNAMSVLLACMKLNSKLEAVS